MSMNLIRFATLAALSLAAMTAARAIAGDAEHAKRSLDTLERFLADGTPDGIRHAQEYADIVQNDLEGLDAATRTPLLKRLDDDTKKISAAVFAREKQKYSSRVETEMDPVRNLGSPEQENVRPEFASSSRNLDLVEKELASPEAAKYLDPAVLKRYADELALARKKFAEKNVKFNFDYAQSRLESVEGGLPEFLNHAKEAEATGTPEAIDSDVRSFSSQISMVSKQIKAMPLDNPAVKKLLDRLAAVNETFEAAVVRVQGKEIYNEMKGSWEGRMPEAAGWNKETIGATLAQFIGPRSEKTDALNAPRTVAMVTAGNWWLARHLGVAYAGGEMKEDNYRAFLRDLKVKALADEITQQRDAAETNLLKFTVPLVDEAEKAKLSPEARERFQILIERTFPESLAGSPRFKPVLERIKALAEGK